MNILTTSTDWLHTSSSSSTSKKRTWVSLPGCSKRTLFVDLFSVPVVTGDSVDDSFEEETASSSGLRLVCASDSIVLVVGSGFIVTGWVTWLENKSQTIHEFTVQRKRLEYVPCWHGWYIRLGICSKFCKETRIRYSLGTRRWLFLKCKFFLSVTADLSISMKATMQLLIKTDPYSLCSCTVRRCTRNTSGWRACCSLFSNCDRRRACRWIQPRNTSATYRWISICIFPLTSIFRVYIRRFPIDFMGIPEHVTDIRNGKCSHVYLFAAFSLSSEHRFWSEWGLASPASRIIDLLRICCLYKSCHFSISVSVAFSNWSFPINISRYLYMYVVSIVCVNINIPESFAFCFVTLTARCSLCSLAFSISTGRYESTWV